MTAIQAQSEHSLLHCPYTSRLFAILPLYILRNSYDSFQLVGTIPEGRYPHRSQGSYVIGSCR